MVGTALANERTFLAWVRTSLTLFSFGYGILKVENYLGSNKKGSVAWYDHVVAYFFTFAAICAFCIGSIRFMKVKSVLKVDNALETGKSSMRLFIVTLASVMVIGLAREILNDALADARYGG